MQKLICRVVSIGLTVFTFGCLVSCTGPSITAVRLSPTPDGQKAEPPGIPYYLPKPYLFVTKNFYYIPAPTVGLTAVVNIPGTFDTSSNSPGGGSKPGGSNSPPSSTTKSNTPPSSNAGGGSANQNGAELASDDIQPDAAAAPAAGSTHAGSTGDPATNNITGDTQNGKPGPSTNASTVNNSNGGQVLWAYPGTNAMIPAPTPDGLIPQDYYTYQIIYLPDLTQKYGLRINGNYGELRATENLVNGWMHTGPGPFYMKNSSSADMVTAVGQATGSILQSVEQGVLSGLGIPSLPGGSAASGATQKTGGIEAGANSNAFTITNYAVLYIFEPELTSSNTVEWKQICQLTNSAGALGPISFDRYVLAVAQQNSNTPPPPQELATNTSLETQITGFITTNYEASYKFFNLTAPPKYFGPDTATINVGGGVQTNSGATLGDADLKAFNTDQLPKDVKAFLNAIGTNTSYITIKSGLTNQPSK